jgi:signal transduction histidine kinase
VRAASYRRGVIGHDARASEAPYWWGRPAPPPIVLSGALAVVQIVGTVFAAHGQNERADLDVLAVCLLLAGPALLLFRRQHPVAVLAGVFAVTILYLSLDYPFGPLFLSAVVALFTTVNSGHRVAAWVTAAVGYVGLVLVLLARDEGVGAGDFLGAGAWMLVVLVVAEFARSRRERFAEAMHARQEEERRQVSDERLRIAQDVHDLVAHHISLINVQAGTALHVMDKQPEQARVALGAIKDSSNQALRDLRATIDVLRRPGEQAPLAPSPGVDDIGSLVDGARKAGLDVSTRLEAAPDGVPPAVDLAAYRIVQEALTNVVRHAGPARVTVHVAYTPTAMTIDVDDDGRGMPASAEEHVGSGNGIPGMRERAAAQGGSLEAEPKPGGGFRVHAWLPISGDA